MEWRGGGVAREAKRGVDVSQFISARAFGFYHLV